MENLISMTDYPILQWDKDIYTDDFAQLMIKYANFLKQPLKLGMFVPCDENGNVLEDGVNWNKNFYNKAKERCLFEGFEIKECISALDAEKFIGVTYKGTWCGSYYNFISTRLKENNTVEGLTILQPQLTPTALKQIGL